MDAIQKVLVKAGRKDLAQKYYEKVSGKKAQAETGTFKCPDCGSKVLNNTKYCVKCKEKKEPAGD